MPGLALKILCGLLGWGTLLLAIICLLPAFLGLTDGLANIREGNFLPLGIAFALLSAGLFVSGGSLVLYASERKKKRTRLLVAGMLANVWLVLFGLYLRWNLLALDMPGRLPLVAFALMGLGLANAAVLVLLHRAWLRILQSPKIEQSESHPESSE